jgi:zinc/manganese transport system permease protein
MVDLLFAPFADFAFMRRALAGACALSVSGTPLGLFLILRRMSLSGDAISHAILPGAALGYLVAGLSLPAMTIGGLAAGLIVALAAGAVARVTVLREDASLAAFYLLSLALGVTLVSLRGSNVDLLHVLFGNVLALDDPALMLLAGIASVTLFGLAVLYRALVIETLDPSYLALRGHAAAATQFAFFALVVLNLVGGFYALGTLMAVGLMMLPAVSARLWTQNLDMALVLGMVFGILSSWLGLVLSFQYALPSGPAIVLCAGGIYLVSIVFGRVGGLVRLLPGRRHLEA